tara:strand:+ start:696 stop:1310 length:615 start_codon:yes stop_codon:yes gene_type:complete
MALVSVALLKEYLPEVSGSSLDTELTRMIARTESTIARWLGFPIFNSGTSPSLSQNTYTLYLDGPKNSDSNVIQLPVKPLVSVTSIHSDVNLVYGSDTLIPSASYELDTQNSKIYLLPEQITLTFDSGYRALKIICSAGYNTSTPPDDLVMAVLIWCSALQRNKASQGKESISQRNSTVKLSPKNMPEEVKQLLYPFRNPLQIL